MDGREVKELKTQAMEAVKSIGLSQLHHVALLRIKPHPNAVYNEETKFWCSPIEDGVEVVTFEKGCPFHPLLQENPHVCFLVDNMDQLVDGRFPVLLGPFDSTMGRAAFIYVNQFVIELMELK